MPHLAIIVASTRPNRAGRQIGDWVVEQARAHGGFEVSLLDLAEINLPFLDEPQDASTAKRQYTHEHTRRWSQQVEAADAFIIVMPEYNHSFNAPLKNALDYLYYEWHYKPVGLVNYGLRSLGLRASIGIKPVLSALKMMPTAEYIGLPIHEVIDGAGQAHFTAAHEKQLHGILGELGRLTEAFTSLREANRPPANARN